jgi:hypothetical protein
MSSFRFLLPAVIALTAILPGGAADLAPGVRKVGESVIYQENRFYATFPSVVKRPDGELLVAFRRAPSRVALGEKGESHVDPNSYLVMVRSRDGGATWTKAPELIYAHAFGGSQDPCLLQLRDGTLLCSSYGWAFLQPEAAARGFSRRLPGALLGWRPLLAGPDFPAAHRARDQP